MPRAPGTRFRRKGIESPWRPSGRASRGEQIDGERVGGVHDGVVVPPILRFVFNRWGAGVVLMYCVRFIRLLSSTSETRDEDSSNLWAAPALADSGQLSRYRPNLRAVDNAGRNLRVFGEVSCGAFASCPTSSPHGFFPAPVRGGRRRRRRHAWQILRRKNHAPTLVLSDARGTPARHQRGQFGLALIELQAHALAGGDKLGVHAPGLVRLSLICKPSSTSGAASITSPRAPSICARTAATIRSRSAMCRIERAPAASLRARSRAARRRYCRPGRSHLCPHHRVRRRAAFRFAVAAPHIEVAVALAAAAFVPAV